MSNTRPFIQQHELLGAGNYFAMMTFVKTRLTEAGLADEAKAYVKQVYPLLETGDMGVFMEVTQNYVQLDPPWFVR